MCGYARRHIANGDLAEFMRSIEMENLLPRIQATGSGAVEHFYPAFGGCFLLAYNRDVHSGGGCDNR